MHTPTITVKELSDSPVHMRADSQPPSLSSSRNNSSESHPTSSTRNSGEAPRVPNANTLSYEATEAARTKGNPLEEQKRDYSLWLTRMMGKQLVEGINDNEGEEGGD
jgi:hypothetical protein